VCFELYQSGGGVRAHVLTARECVTKGIPSATPEAARAARFEFDETLARARFVMEGAEVLFEHRDGGGWSMLPVVTHLPDSH